MGLDRKRKSMNALQSTDKKRKSLEDKQSSSDDSDEHSDQDNGLNDEVKNENSTVRRWPQDDIKKLLSQMEKVLPKIDNTTFRNRLTKLDWEKIQFDKYTKDECQSTWLAIQDQIRTYKTLGDLVNDAKTLLATKGIDTYLSKQNRVQRPKSAYMLYYTDILQKYKKKHPNLKLPQLTQIIAEKYKTLPPEKMQIYIDKAQQLKTEYNELVGKTNIGVKSKVIDTLKPKTPFNMFLEANATELTNTTNMDKAEIQNHLKDKWENMSEKKKSKWIKLAKEREQTYFNKIKEDHKNDPAFTMPTKSALSKGDRDILDSQSGKPKKPPVNNYGLFSKETLQSDELSGVPPKERMALLAKKWKAFTDEERQMYSDKLKVITERYKAEYEAYLRTLPEDEKLIELAKNKVKPKKAEPKVLPRINAREGIPEKPKKKNVSKYNSKTDKFENEPLIVPHKNSFELYKSKKKSKDKHPIETLEEWNNSTGKKKIMYDNELKLLKKEYMKNLKIFLKSLSEDDLQLYLKLRKPELLATGLVDKGSVDKSGALEKEESSSSEDDDDDDDDDDNDSE